MSKIYQNGTALGVTCGVVAAMTYGTNPLFSKNLYAMGMDVESVLFYRFCIATLVFGVVMGVRGVSLRVTRREAAWLLGAGVVFALSSQALYESFLYMDAGVACAILFCYPLMVALIMIAFFHERASAFMLGCIALAMVGIALLYNGKGRQTLSLVGVALVMLSSLCYAIYMVGVGHSRILSSIESQKMTFWVLLGGMLLFVVTTRGLTALQPVPPTVAGWANAVGVGLIPTIVPIFFINIAIKHIGPTLSAILGALEPVTAMAIGVGVFHEELTPRIALGAILILVAVTLVVARPLLGKLRRR